MKVILPFGGDPLRRWSWSWPWTWLWGGNGQLGGVLILVGLFCVHAMAQPGRIDLFSNGARAPVYSPDSVDCYTSELDLSRRSKLNEGYIAQAWYAPGENVREEELLPVPDGIAPIRRNGVYLKSGKTYLPGVAGGDLISLQIRVWRQYDDLDSGLWDEKLFAILGVEFGKTDVVTMTAGGSRSDGSVVLPLSLVGKFPSFGLACAHPTPLRAEEDRDSDGLPDAYEVGGMGRYRLIRGFYTLFEAQAVAAGYGGHLATLIWPGEMASLLEVLGESLNSGEFWVGGSIERGAHEWTWMTGEEVSWDFWEGKPLPQEASGLTLSRGEGVPVVLDARRPDAIMDGFVLEFGKWSSPGSADTDGDGASDLAEAAFGSSPLQANSLPTVPLKAMRRVEVEVVAPLGSRYQLQYGIGPAWYAFGLPLDGMGEVQRIAIPAGHESERAPWRIGFLP